jgi:hypothetical protein
MGPDGPTSDPRTARAPPLGRGDVDGLAVIRTTSSSRLKEPLPIGGICLTSERICSRRVISRWKRMAKRSRTRSRRSL